MTAIEESKRKSIIFFKNIEYLRVKKGITMIQMIADIKKVEGYKVGIHSLRMYRTGKIWKVRLSYLLMFSRYFGTTIEEMLSEDYSSREVNEGLQ